MNTRETAETPEDIRDLDRVMRVHRIEVKGRELDVATMDDGYFIAVGTEIRERLTEYRKASNGKQGVTDGCMDIWLYLVDKADKWTWTTEGISYADIAADLGFVTKDGVPREKTIDARIKVLVKIGALTLERVRYRGADGWHQGKNRFTPQLVTLSKAMSGRHGITPAPKRTRTTEADVVHSIDVDSTASSVEVRESDELITETPQMSPLTETPFAGVSSWSSVGGVLTSPGGSEILSRGALLPRDVLDEKKKNLGQKHEGRVSPNVTPARRVKMSTPGQERTFYKILSNRDPRFEDIVEKNLGKAFTELTFDEANEVIKALLKRDGGHEVIAFAVNDLEKIKRGKMTSGGRDLRDPDVPVVPTVRPLTSREMSDLLYGEMSDEEFRDLQSLKASAFATAARMGLRHPDRNYVINLKMSLESIEKSDQPPMARRQARKALLEEFITTSKADGSTVDQDEREKRQDNAK